MEVAQNTFENNDIQFNAAFEQAGTIAVRQTVSLDEALYEYAKGKIEAQPPVPNGINAIVG